MRLLIVGPGRAGGSVALAAAEAGHQIVGILSRSGENDRLGPPLSWSDRLPETDAIIVAVRDEQIPGVADELATLELRASLVAHLSGFVPVGALATLGSRGLALGGFHPLQSLPDAQRGSEALRGAYAGIEGDGFAVDALTHLAESLGMHPFRLHDEHRPAYHAAAAAAASFVVTSLATSADLFGSAEVDFAVVRPLVERVVTNVFEGDPVRALSGPVVRGDLETVVGHLIAARAVSEDVGEQFRLLVEATAIRAGRADQTKLWS